MYVPAIKQAFYIQLDCHVRGNLIPMNHKHMPHYSQRAPAPFLSASPPPAANTVHSAILRHSHIARYPIKLRHVVWTMGIGVSKAYISRIFSDKMPDDGGNSLTLLPDYTASIPDYSIHIHYESTAGSSSRPHQPQEADSRSSGSACAASTLHIVRHHRTHNLPLPAH